MVLGEYTAQPQLGRSKPWSNVLTDNEFPTQEGRFVAEDFEHILLPLRAHIFHGMYHVMGGAWGCALEKGYTTVGLG